MILILITSIICLSKISLLHSHSLHGNKTANNNNIPSDMTRPKRELTNNNNNFRDEKNNFFVYFNLHSNEANGSNKNNKNQALNPNNQTFDDLKPSLAESKVELINRLLSILLVGLEDRSEQNKQPEPILAENKKPEIILPTLISNENSKKDDSRENYMLMIHNSDALFRVLSFVAFILVMFSCTSTFVLVLFVLNHRCRRCRLRESTIDNDDDDCERHENRNKLDSSVNEVEDETSLSLMDFEDKHRPKYELYGKNKNTTNSTDDKTESDEPSCNKTSSFIDDNETQRKNDKNRFF